MLRFTILLLRTVGETTPLRCVRCASPLPRFPQRLLRARINVWTQENGNPRLLVVAKSDGVFFVELYFQISRTYKIKFYKKQILLQNKVLHWRKCSFCKTYKNYKKRTKTTKNVQKLQKTYKNYKKRTKTTKNVQKLQKTYKNYKKRTKTTKNVQKLQNTQNVQKRTKTLQNVQKHYKNYKTYKNTQNVQNLQKLQNVQNVQKHYKTHKFPREKPKIKFYKKTKPFTFCNSPVTHT